MWLTMILSNWRLILAGLASLLILTLYSWGSTMKAQRDEKTAVIDSMRREATQYREKSETIAKETSDAFTTLTDQIKEKDIALRNARAKFGSCNVARGINGQWLHPLPAGSGQADVSESAHGISISEFVPVDRSFIDTCAADAAYVGTVKAWVLANKLPIGD